MQQPTSLVSAARAAALRGRTVAPPKYAPVEQYRPLANFDDSKSQLGPGGALAQLRRRLDRVKILSETGPGTKQPSREHPTRSQTVRVDRVKIDPKLDRYRNRTTGADVTDLPLLTAKLEDVDAEISEMNAPPVMTPSKVRAKYGQGLIDVLPEDYSVSRQLGKGKYGVALMLVNGPDYVVAKTVRAHTAAERRALNREMYMMRKFNDAGIAPETLVNQPTYYTGKDGKRRALLIMSAVHTTLGEILKGKRLATKDLYVIFSKILGLFSTMYDHKLVHGDVHIENIGVVWTTTSEGVLTIDLKLIDFGFSTDRHRDTYVDVLQLLRTLSGDYAPVINVYNKSLLVEWLYVWVDTNFGLAGIQSQADLERLYDKAFAEYEPIYLERERQLAKLKKK